MELILTDYSQNVKAIVLKLLKKLVLFGPTYQIYLAVAQQLESRFPVMDFVIQEIMTTGPPIWMNYLLDYHLVTNLRFQESMLDMSMIR